MASQSSASAEEVGAPPRIFRPYARRHHRDAPGRRQRPPGWLALRRSTSSPRSTSRGCGTIRRTPTWAERDRFVLSKGHAVPALYACSRRPGYFPKALLPTLRQLGSTAAGPPGRNTIPGDRGLHRLARPGALGRAGHGAGLEARRQPLHVCCMLGDGEMQEGQIWEAAMSAAKFKLDNLTVHPRLQQGADRRPRQGRDAASSRSSDKWRAFDWHVLRDRRPRHRRRSSTRLDAAKRAQGAADLHRRRHRQGQGRLLHGGQDRVARRDAEQRAGRAGRSPRSALADA